MLHTKNNMERKASRTTFNTPNASRTCSPATQSGFTIVELLIVIVVIAILASITIVAYTGIRKQASTVTYTAAADALEKQMRIATIKGPLTQETIQTACLAFPADLPQTATFAAGECRRDEPVSGAPTRYYADQDLAQLLHDRGVQLPTNMQETSVTITGGARIHWRGFVTILTSSGAFYITWMPPDSSSCGRATNTVESLITSVNSDPQMKADFIAAYGVNWESWVRDNYYGGSGYCILLVDE